MLDIIYKIKRRGLIRAMGKREEAAKIKKQSAKGVAREKLIIYLSDPNNKHLTRAQLAKTVLGCRNANTIHNKFTAAELNEIEIEALDIKRKRYAGHISKIDDGLIKRAMSGDVNAAKLAYQRFENWAPSKELKLKADMKVNIDKDDAGCL